MRRIFNNSNRILFTVALFFLSAKGAAQPPVIPALVGPIPIEEKIKVSADFYAAQSNLMPFEGYQNDLITTLYSRHDSYKFLPLLRYVVTNYYYLNKGVPPNNRAFTSDRRTAIGLGFDYRFNTFFKFRFLLESIDNKMADKPYTQDSYGLIYNQYLEFKYFELNNYVESFYIPRVSTKNNDTFVKVQALKSHYLNRSAIDSNVVFGFSEIKAKINDDSNFGVSGYNFSIGPGYRYYSVNNFKDSFAFVIELHSVLYQSRDLFGDWLQMQAALQLWID